MPIYTNAYIGKKYGKLTITGQGPYNEKSPSDILVYVDCDCGTKNKIVRFIDLTRTDIRQTTGKKNGTFTCGECYGKDLIGQKINHLTILELHPSKKEEDLKNGIKVDTSTMVSTELSKYRAKRCTVKCECGTSDPFIWILMDVKSGRKRQCDEFDCTYARRHTHKNDNGEKIGASKNSNPAYCTWAGMIKRCYDPNHNSYPRYGGRGIKVCWDWSNKNENGLYNFSKWWLVKMEEINNNSNYTLDRIDSTKDYSPDNCRLATKSTQTANQTQYKIFKRPFKHVRPYYSRKIEDKGKNIILGYEAYLEYEHCKLLCRGFNTSIEALIGVYWMYLKHDFKYNVLNKFPFKITICDKLETLSHKRFRIVWSNTLDHRDNEEVKNNKQFIITHNYKIIEIDKILPGERCLKYQTDQGNWVVSPIVYSLDILDKLVLLINSNLINRKEIKNDKHQTN